MDNEEQNRREEKLTPELMFLMWRWLCSMRLEMAANALIEDVEKRDLLPKRTDWQGNQHRMTFEEYRNRYPHVTDDHILKICTRFTEVMDKENPPSVTGVCSLLGAGSQSLLRQNNNVTRLNLTSSLCARINGSPMLPSPKNIAKCPSNFVNTITARQTNGPSNIKHLISTKIYAKQLMHKRQLGHLSSVYCISFDRSGNYIFTGADDNLVKIWSATDARLLATLRGHMDPITDLAVNYENTLLAAGSCDKMIRVWCLRTTSPICILTGHSGTITSLKFCPYSRDNNRYLVSTASDGCVCFWSWDAITNEFQPKPLKFNERTKAGAQLLCSSFSGGGAFLAVGSTDHHVRVYRVSGPNGPEKILEIEAHSDQVDSLQFSNLGFRFLSGSKDGTANIWWFERQSWKSHLLNMNEKLPGQTSPDESELKTKLRVTMVCWTTDDAYVVTAVSDHSLKLWDSNTGKLLAILKHHEDEVFVIEAHPFDPRVILSGGHDGRIILWDVVQMSVIRVFINNIEGQGHGSIFDCKFSADGQFIASTDSHGHLTIYGFGSSERYKKVPKEVFFHTDYRPLIRDSNHYVIDEQTQCAPHLMPPPFLVDIDGNPYEPIFQRLVPGRENCRDEQLVPYIAIQNASGVAEVLEPVHRHDESPPLPAPPPPPPPPPPSQPQPSHDGDHRPTIDDMIERFQQEQERQRVNYEHGYAALPRCRLQTARRTGGPPGGAPSRRPPAGLRRSIGNWQSRGNNDSNPVWKRRIVVRPLKYSFVKKFQQQFMKYAALEEALFSVELKRKPLIAPLLVKESLTKERVTRRRRRINEQRQGVLSRNVGATFRSSSNRRHTGIIDYENPEDLLTPEESGSNFSGSGADSWEESSSETESESEDDDDDDDAWPFNNDNDNSKKNRGKVAKSSTKKTKKVKKEKGSSCEEQSKEEDSAAESVQSSDRTDSDDSSPKNKCKANVKLDVKVTKYPDWLIGVVPKRSPYFPQIGDEVIYVRLAHERYLDAVRNLKQYKLHPRTHASKRKNVKDEQLVRITKIEYDFLPPIVVNLTLLVVDDEGKDTSESFSVRYHDIPDVLDFLVLKQSYYDAMSRNWQVNDRFRSVIDDKWWFGTIVEKTPQKSNSSFQCFKVLWDNNEEELMSPWDIEPIDEACKIKTGMDGIPVQPEERPQIYIPTVDEWPEHGMDAECERIILGLEKIRDTSWAEHFNAPVDLSVYPNYVQCVPYPIDLNTIKARLENRMYRRLDALKFDIEFIEINAKLFNEPKSDIRLKARIVTDLCKRFITDTNCVDPSVFIQEINHNKEMYESTENEDEENAVDDNTRSSRTRKRKLKADPKKQVTKKMKFERREINSNTWKQQAKELIDLMFRSPDSEPFRFQVDPIQYPDYNTVVDTPMDLSTVREQLIVGIYSNPSEFNKDMNLIFTNSRNYNTNKRSRIYAMTCRLKAFFEDKIKSILSDYRSARSHEKKCKRQNTRNVKVAKRKPVKKNVDEKKERRAQRKKPFDPFSQPSTSGYSNNGVVTNGYTKAKLKKVKIEVMSDDETKPLVNGCVNGVIRTKSACKRIVSSDSEKECNGKAASEPISSTSYPAFSNYDEINNHTNSETEIDTEKNDTDATEIEETNVKAVTRGVKRPKRRAPRRSVARRARSVRNSVHPKIRRGNVTSGDSDDFNVHSPGSTSVNTESSEEYIASRTSNSAGFGSEFSGSDFETGVSTRRTAKKVISYHESDFEYDSFGNQETVSSRGRIIKLKGHARASVNC